MSDNLPPGISQDAVDNLFADCKIKPCPFCGVSTATYDSIYSEYEYNVHCANKACAVRPSTNDYQIEQDAIDAWNKRSM